jgi:purine nucleoside phosphorylase
MFRLPGKDVINMTTVPEVSRYVPAPFKDVVNMTTVPEVSQYVPAPGKDVVNMTAVQEVRQDMWDPGRRCGQHDHCSRGKSICSGSEVKAWST